MGWMICGEQKNQIPTSRDKIDPDPLFYVETKN